MKKFIPAIMVLAAIAVAGCNLPRSPYREALPPTATEILEHRSGTVDFTYQLRARITREEFRAYVSGQQLIRQPASPRPAVKPPSPDNRGSDDPAWWPAGSTLDEIHELRKDGDIIRAGYQDGFLYLSVVHI